MSTTGWIVLGVIVVIALWVITVYNGLVAMRQRVGQAFADIDVQLKQRHDLIPNLVETVKGYAAHERGTLEAVTQARNTAMAAQGPAQQAAAENMLSGALRQLFAPGAIIARTSLIIGRGNSQHEKYVHALAAGTTAGVLFADDIRCPIHVTDLASALLELGQSRYSGIHHIAGADALSRHELGVLIARRDGLDDAKLRSGLRAQTGPPGPLEVRLDCVVTQSRLKTRLR